VIRIVRPFSKSVWNMAQNLPEFVRYCSRIAAGTARYNSPWAPGSEITCSQGVKLKRDFSTARPDVPQERDESKTPVIPLRMTG